MPVFLGMLNAPTLTPPLSSADLRALHNRVVLVRSSRDHRNPPTAMRGWVEVHDGHGGGPEIGIAIEFPQMFTTRAHHRVIPLDTAGVERLLASERDGTFEFFIDDDLG